ncbi:hypothetical protein DW842_16735 [Ruminococcus sp. AM36-17]|nr:hypothetical protein DW842_16735 [Ruminococcus sp. AM36-17]
MEKLSVEELEELREKEFDERAERAERIQNTISLFRKIACVLAVMIAAAFIFFHVRKDYNNYAGSQLVMAEVINVEGADDENINVTYQYNIAGKKYESDKIQYTEKINGEREIPGRQKVVRGSNVPVLISHAGLNPRLKSGYEREARVIKKGDKKEIRVKKNNPEVILKCNDINYVVLCDVLIGLCLELAVLCLYEMATCTLPSAAEEVKAKDIVFTTTPGVTFSSIVEENKKKNKK